jgi:hypothetical protein
MRGANYKFTVDWSPFFTYTGTSWKYNTATRKYSDIGDVNTGIEPNSNTC